MPQKPPAKQSASKPSQHPAEPFLGFEHFTANFVYCPNQFFDVCLPNCSRGVVRLVAYLLRRTLGWLDENGNPVEQDITVSYRDLISKAGVSRGALRKAIDEAITAGFIHCTRQGQANSSGKAAQTAQYALQWDTDSSYVKDRGAFRGFYAGEGHRSQIPNAFFDQVVTREPLAVVKVVGTVLRHTVGYQNQFGGRRSHAPLSYTYIQNYAKLSDRSTLSAALRHATAAGYIRCVDKGTFDSSSTRRKPGTYAVKWLVEAPSKPTGSETRPAQRDRFKNPTSNGSRTIPAERSKNPTKEKTLVNNTSKQQREDVPFAVAAHCVKPYLLLREVGFDEQTANDLSHSRSSEQIQQQINWLDDRNPKRNRLGLLRRAIEENWSEPITAKEDKKKQATRQREEQQEAKQAAEEAAAAEQKHQRLERREALLARWRRLTVAERKRHHQMAVEQSDSTVLRRRLLAHADLNEPPTETLKVMARALALPVGDSS